MLAAAQNTERFAFPSPEVQIERVRRFLYDSGGIWSFKRGDTIPPFPGNHELELGEIPLLCPYLYAVDRDPGSIVTLRSLCDYMVLPEGYDKSTDDIDFDHELMKLLEGVEYEPGVRWVGYEPTANIDEAVRSCWENPGVVSLAGIEVFTASTLYPEYSGSWNGTSRPFPNAGGIRVKVGRNANAGVPYFYRDDERKTVVIGRVGIDVSDPRWSIPTARRLG